MPIWPFRPSRAGADAETLLGQVTAASRNPALFGEKRVPDTLDGRFEIMTICAALALMRLGRDPGAAPLAQAFTDRFFKFLDAGLREAGVGDTAVPKRMRRLAGSFYGRLSAYAEALEDEAALEAALARNVWRLPAHPFAAELAERVRKTATAQAALPITALFEASGWRQD
jgi:cytochrome b pre-mRNA-processing protein 3